MSEYKNINEAIFEMPEINISRKKSSPVVPLIILIAGVVLLAMSKSIGGWTSSANVSSSSMLIGFIITIVGIIKVVSAVKGKGVPFYNDTYERLYRYELPFDISQKDQVRQYLDEGDFESLADLPQGEASGLLVVVYKVRSGEIALAQLQKYVPHSYRAASDIKIYRKGQYITSSKLG